MELDLDHLRQWIGKEETATELLTPALVERFNATLDREGPTESGSEAPLLIHHCLCQPAAPTSALGPDGHPKRGGFLPPVALPRRMWAGGALTFHSPLRIGEKVTRRSVIDDLVVKQGRTGILCFVTVSHHITAGGRDILTERQDIVYRDANKAGSASSKPVEAAPQGERHRRIDASPVLLFRYSALTFNSHRIHYDAPYVTEIEHYPGLIVHGPMQAMLLVQYAQELKGRAPARFSFRSVAPIFAGTDFTLNATDDGEALKLWTASMEGPIAMEANAEW
ncbi:MaoC family dehydratase N-terminal domain-containing protein [Notoacmeibacter sp. MSK16QG-6]|uniref:FAS1-like dehydratase domain-containing protein n=1 Tax=Notoacmeibacter sp. MSK16QG-6 TaxID=2957982 RepID=UPI00209E02A3|nr:MaoC family dehydratase N-terminal domain-containing protein [Notoacmeibacter sp. MSK16QG-6]MCP1198297.1 MaoC family dehydratase N-terminal domain-containing protein [Notoacmeibacter sp. MSK16QG-6]